MVVAAVVVVVVVVVLVLLRWNYNNRGYWERKKENVVAEIQRLEKKRWKQTIKEREKKSAEQQLSCYQRHTHTPPAHSLTRSLIVEVSLSSPENEHTHHHPLFHTPDNQKLTVR